MLTSATIEVLQAPAGEATTVVSFVSAGSISTAMAGYPSETTSGSTWPSRRAHTHGQAPPKIDTYPTVNEAKGIDLDPANGAVGTAGSSLVIQNVSYAGHTRWTDPAPSYLPRSFRLDVPGKCNQRILIRLLPKRFASTRPTSPTVRKTT